MAAREFDLKKWQADKTKWEAIFGGALPRQDSLKKLIDEWIDFSNLTMAIHDTPQNIPGGPEYQAEAEAFYKRALGFFKNQHHSDPNYCSSLRNPPMPADLRQSLKSAAQKMEQDPLSPYSIEAFKTGFLKTLDQLDKEMEREQLDSYLTQREKQVELEGQAAVAAVDQDPFYVDINAQVQIPLQDEIDRISRKDAHDPRLVHLNAARDEIATAIEQSKSNRKMNHNIVPVESREACKEAITKAINTNLFDNKALEETPTVKFGKGLLNALIAIPAAIRSFVTDKKASDSFYSFKTRAHETLSDLKTKLDDIPADPKPEGPRR